MVGAMLRPVVRLVRLQFRLQTLLTLMSAFEAEADIPDPLADVR